MRNSTISSGRGPVPMCVDPLGAHGSPTATHSYHRKIPSFQQKTAPALQGPQPPMCNIEDDRRPPGTPATPRIEIGPVPARDRSGSARPTRRRGAHDELEGESHMPHLGTIGEQQTRGTRPISSRNATDLGAEVDRSRHGLRPISTRKWTDLGAGYDRSRAGMRPISAKGCAGVVRAGQGRPGSGPARGGRGQWLSGLSRAIRSASRS